MVTRDLGIQIDDSESGLLPSSGSICVMAGPSHAESEEQVLHAARTLKELGGVSVFRAGSWGSRTQSGPEDTRSTVLRWLERSRKELGLANAAEISDARSVEACLRHGIDILWTDTETSSNPDTMDEIASALRGTGAAVLVENPRRPDIRLWIDALERLNKAGVSRLGAVFRGFDGYQGALYRSESPWSIPIELRRMLPDLLLVCDLCKMASARHLMPEVAQQAIDLGMTGLTVETRHDPATPPADQALQLTPAELGAMLASLVVKHRLPSEESVSRRIEELRRSIDEVDIDLLQAFAARVALVKEIGQYKKASALTVYQVERWNDILRTRVRIGRALGLSESFVLGLFDLIHTEAIEIQMKITRSD